MADNDPFDSQTLVYLSELSRLYPTSASALSCISRWEAELTLPKGTVHVISDIHGENQKLRHVINNASGCIRPLIDQLFSHSLSQQERLELLNLIYYPLETSRLVFSRLHDASLRQQFVSTSVSRQAQIVRALACRYTLEHLEKIFPQELKLFFQELLFAPQLHREEEFIASMIRQFTASGREIDLLRAMSRVIRNLSIAELIIAGDFGDRGPRIDLVIDYVMRQPSVAITWGNHDVSWMGACLGSPVCIATVVRISMRYQRLAQLEEGYGIPLTPLEDLATTVYGSDSAERFKSKGEGSRDAQLVARMQKAMAIIQFKLEGQVSHRNPHFNYENRNLLHQCNFVEGTVRREGKTYKLLDTFFPTIDPSNPYALSQAENNCVEQLKESFLFSPRLWSQMKYLSDHGNMFAIRDENLIFHGCTPVNQQGEFLPFAIDGKEYKGRALFDQLNLVVPRAFRERRTSDLDLLWYLWSGPLSPLFGKDCMATFETYFLAEKETHQEHKNPYFSLIHDKAFCEKVLNEFGVSGSHGLIVNGHVPVKIEAGESPLKKSGKAVTIDGAFSEAYGDKGYTLVLEADRTYLAQHHHFESVQEALNKGTDIVPTIQVLREFSPPRTVRETERGNTLRHHIKALNLLIQAYQENRIQEER